MSNLYNLLGVLAYGTHAARPAANAVAVGTVYAESDTKKAYQSDGAAWNLWLDGSASGMTNPMTTKGDVILGDTSGTPSRLAAGASGYVLTSNGAGAFPSWQAAAGGAFPQVSVVQRTAGDLTTTSTSWGDVTSLTTTITTGAHRCLVNFAGVAKNSNATFNTMFDIDIDGTRQGQAYGSSGVGGGSGVTAQVGFSLLTPVLSAGSHTIKVVWRVDNGSTTGTLFASTSVWPATLTVIETLQTS